MVLIRLNCIPKKDLMSSRQIQKTSNHGENCPRQTDAQSSLAHFIGTGQSELVEKLVQSAKFSRAAISEHAWIRILADNVSVRIQMSRSESFIHFGQR
jgi:hypothetical protein